MSQASSLFNKKHLSAHRLRAEKKNHNGSDFLLRWAEIEMKERLEDIKREFKSALLLSPAPSQNFTAYLLNKAEKVDTGTGVDLLSDELFPYKPNSYDLIVSFFDLHHMNDLVGWLIQIKNALTEDGAFIACMTGGETLHELRQTMMLSEIEVMGGASPRVLPFVTKQQMGDLMQRAGFSLPVVDSETITGSYRDLYHLMSDLRAMGETNCLNDRYKYFTPSRLFYEAANLYATQYAESDGRIAATFEIIFIIGWSPSDTQQKPLRRGSGQIHLSSVLEE